VVDLVVLVRLCPRCGVQLPYPGRGPCEDCRRTYERERSRARRATSAAVKARNSQAWQRIRDLAKRRDGFRCRQCGSSEKIEAHHIQGLAQGGSAFSLENVITLCARCHRKESAKGKPALLGVPRTPEILGGGEKQSQKTHREIKSRGASPQSGEVSIG
jgi:5-methylcytosine-specific restriction endonuclease McrA